MYDLSRLRLNLCQTPLCDKTYVSSELFTIQHLSLILFTRTRVYTLSLNFYLIPTLLSLIKNISHRNFNFCLFLVDELAYVIMCSSLSSQPSYVVQLLDKSRLVGQEFMDPWRFELVPIYMQLLYVGFTLQSQGIYFLLGERSEEGIGFIFVK